MSDFDIAIIGSGAAGSVIAWQLVQRGLRVAVLEKGRRQDPTTFEHTEFQMMPRLYKHGGFQTTKNNDLVILQASTVGGSTVVNNAIWMRADLKRILPQWSALGAHIDEQALTSGYTAMERLLKVDEIPLDIANAATKPFLDACALEGIPARRLKNNREECIGCGWCNYGCRYNRKTSMLVTLIPWAERLGAQVIDDCQDLRLIHKKDRVTRAEFWRGGKLMSIEADRFVVSGGAIGSSELLLQSGIDCDGLVGRGLHVLGGVVVNGRMKDAVSGYDGIGLTCVADGGPTHVVETFYSPPGAFAVTLGGWFEEHAKRMKDYAYYMQAGVMVGTEPRGAVTLGNNKTASINLTFSKQEVAALRDGIKFISRIFFRAGAEAVIPSTYNGLTLKSVNELPQLDKIIRSPDDLLLGSAHPQGGNPMNDNPQKGVVDSRFHVHGFKNLYVSDASVFPTNIWVNCQATVMAVAYTAADMIAEDAGTESSSPPADALQYEIRKRWRNHDSNQTSVPLRTYRPASLDEVVTIINEAERLHVGVRAIGSSHSWSDVAVTNDFLLLPERLAKPLELDRSLLRPRARTLPLVEVQAGMRIHELNAFLDQQGRAIENMGGYDGQTIAGVMATSTHGSGTEFGPLAEMIQSVDLVASGGRIYRIEPMDGITDSVIYRQRYPQRTLMQDDNWYRAVLVSMGSMGVMYSVILRTVPKFWLKEVRSLTTWEDVKEELRKGTVFTLNEHYELLLNPYAVDKKHACLVTTRNSCPQPAHLPPDKSTRNPLNELVSLLPITGPFLRGWFDANPTKIPDSINRTLESLVDDAYINVSYKVFNIGAANDIDSYSCELAVPMEGFKYIDAVDRILLRAAEMATAGNIYQSGPIAMRFVKKSDFLLSMQQGGNTCMLELIGVKDTLGILEIFYRFEHDIYEIGGRPHWGQMNSVNGEEVHRLYPFLQDWLKIRKQMDPQGTFNSPFSWRAGLNQTSL
jgi:choline dehydrogenase-like flavoprotein/FAD/FMN-containing dehydrogenase